MNKNVGGFDRTARLVLGPVLVLVAIAGYAGMVTLAFGPVPQALASILVLLVGAVLLVTGVVRVCPAFSLLGLSTAGGPGSTEDSESPEQPGAS